MLFDIQKHQIIRTILLISCVTGIGLFKTLQQEGFHFGVGVFFLALGVILCIDLILKIRNKGNKRAR